MSTSTQTPTDSATQTQHVDLAISGMTCASCSARIERKLNKVDGVQASVNLATEKASVTFPSALSVTDIVGVVEKTGYGATPLVEDATGPGRAPAMTRATASAWGSCSVRMSRSNRPGPRRASSTL